MKYSLLIFDWDGTLSDSAGHIIQSFHEACEKLSLTPPEANKIRALIGISLAQIVALCFPDATEYLITDFVRHYRASYLSKPVLPSLFEGVVPLLQTLQEKGYLLAVATGKGRVGLDRDLTQHGLLKTFLATRTVDECPSKPAPDMLEEILFELDVEPCAALMIGDSIYDIQMANKAGVPALGVTYGTTSKDHLSSLACVGLIDSPNELIEWLG